MDASIKCKSKFEKEIKGFKNLVPVQVPKWAGIGAVRYIPDYLIEKIDEIQEYQLKKSKCLEKDDSNCEEDTKTVSQTDTESNNAEPSIDPNDASLSIGNEAHQVVQKAEDDLNENQCNDPILEKHISDINDLNDKLVKKLQAQDGAFSSGEAFDNMLAVKFGMVNDLEALKKLAFEVQVVGKEVEESSRVLKIF